MKKRILSMLIAVVMVLSLLPTVALAGASKLSAPVLSVYCRASDGKPVVKWNAISGAAKYEVYRATKKTGTYKKMMTVTSTKYTNTSAKVGHAYFYKVRAVSGNGKISSFSAGRCLTCDCARPVVSITCNSANKPKLTWKAIDGAAKYAVYRSTDGGKTYKHLSDTTKTSFTNTSAKLNITYRYKVKAISSATKNANSAMSAVKKIKCLPNPVLKSVSNTTSGVLVKWGAVSGAAKYRVYYKTGSGSWTKAGNTTNTSLTVKGLTNGKKYSFTVRCLNADGMFVSYYDTTGKSITRKKTSSDKIDITQYTCRVENVEYTGKAVEPKIEFYTYIGYYDYPITLEKGVDYSVTYENNVEIGTAQATITGKGSYTGTMKKSFKVSKIAAPTQISVEKSSCCVGETVEIISNKPLVGKITYKSMDINDRANTTNLDISQNGIITAKEIGWGRLYISWEGDKTHEGGTAYLGEFTVYPKLGEELSGFDLSSSYRKTKNLKQENIEVEESNGIATWEIEFQSNATEKWLDKHITFEVTDVTPKALKNATEAAKWNQTEPTLKIKTASINHVDLVLAPKNPNNYKDGFEYKSDVLSAKKLVIECGIGVYAVKVDAFKDGMLYDRIYVILDYVDKEKNNLSEKLYTQIRHKIESRLWTNDMTNFEKLSALAGYINSTAHYPGYGCTQKEINQTLWDRLSVNDDLLFYDCNYDATLDRVLDLQGGIGTCVIADIIETAAMEDLGLPYIYHSDTDSIDDTEGVWIGMGSKSTNPSYPAHVTLWYKDANGNVHPFDVQGRMVDTSCEEHRCLDHLINLCE